MEQKHFMSASDLNIGTSEGITKSLQQTKSSETTCTCTCTIKITR